MFSDIYVQGGQIVLIPYHMSDVDDLYAAYGDPKVMQYIPEGQMSRAWVERLVDWMVNHCYRHNTPAHIEKFGVSIQHLATKKVIGWCGLGALDCEPEEIELFYGLASAYWGHGYATEAARLMLQYGFDVIGLNRIVALAHPDNMASARVLEKAGMRFERLYETDDPHFAGYNHEAFYVMTRDMFTAPHKA